MSVRMVMVAAAVVLATAAHAQPTAPGMAQELLAAKRALYDSNFRNDRGGLTRAIDRAQRVADDDALRPMALYYAAWGEWALSHSQLQAGDIPEAQATLVRAEAAGRAALTLRPDDVELVVMLADVLIWRVVAEPPQMAALAAEIRTLRDRARAAHPENPRAMIMEAGLIFNTPPERGGDRAKGLALWQRAIARFEQEAAQPSSDPLRPDWGLALAYAWVCDLHLAMRPRQVEEARSAAKKALTLRPDFWYVTDVITPRLQ